MGKYSLGILGPFSGKIGVVIGAFWRGIDYMRSLPRKSNKPPTEAQLKQQMIFGLVMGFLRPIADLIKIGFQSNKSKGTPMNAASAYHLENAITGVYPNLSIKFEKVMISKGVLPRVTSYDVATTVTGKIDFTWVNDANVKYASDLVTVVVFNPVKNLFVYLDGAAARSAQLYKLSVPADFSGDTVQMWLYFVSANSKQVSDSTYLGELELL
jgi:hypothetical protein